MAVNSRGFLFVLFFFCLANALFSQDNDSQKHRIAWTKDDYALRYEVLIEKEENNEHSLVLREFTEEPFIYFSLPPGDYRICVIPYDFRNIPAEGTEWKKFSIVAVTGPASESPLMDDVPSVPSEEIVVSRIHPVKRSDLFIGLFAEGIGYSRNSIAFGGGITFGGSFYGMGAGLSLLYAQDMENFIFLEALAHFRVYLLRARNNNTGLFLQAEGGVVFFSYEKFETADNLAPVGGLCAGWRFPLGKLWYIEPVIRGGYPYIYGVGLSGGIRFY